MADAVAWLLSLVFPDLVKVIGGLLAVALMVEAFIRVKGWLS